MIKNFLAPRTGHGECIHLYQGDANATGALEYFNFSDAHRAIMRQYPIEKVWPCDGSFVRRSAKTRCCCAQLGDVATLAEAEEGEDDQELVTLLVCRRCFRLFSVMARILTPL